MKVQLQGAALESVLTAIEAYVAGLKNADAAALERAFDAPDAPVVFVNDGRVSYSPISAAIPKWVAGGPLADADIAPALLSLSSLTETLCVATCQMRLKTVTYRDVLTLALTGGAWKIVNKTFVRLEPR